MPFRRELTSSRAHSDENLTWLRLVEATRLATTAAGGVTERSRSSWDQLGRPWASCDRSPCPRAGSGSEQVLAPASRGGGLTQCETSGYSVGACRLEGSFKLMTAGH
jgi:hypothetical protein